MEIGHLENRILKRDLLRDDRNRGRDFKNGERQTREVGSIRTRDHWGSNCRLIKGGMRTHLGTGEEQ